MPGSGGSSRDGTASPTRHEVALWADLTCPWCYLGRHRLNRAVAAFAFPRSVTIRQFPAETDPELPPHAGLSVRAAARRRDPGIEPGPLGSRFARIVRELRAEDLPVDLDRAVAANTFNAHRVVELAWRLGGSALQSAVVERLMAAHFAEGAALDDPQVLARLGPEAGLDEGAIKALLSGRDVADAVLDARTEAAAKRITHLPVTIVDGTHRIDGPQPVDVLLAALHRAAGLPPG